MADKVIPCLEEWAEHYLKNKDLMRRKIISIDKNKDGFNLVVNQKDKKLYIFIKPVLDNIIELLEKLDEKKHITLIILNTKENLDVIIKNWDKLANFQNFSIIFVSPFSKTETKWIIHPHVHNRVSDDDSLKRGLTSMFESVERTSKEEIERNID